MGLHVPPPISLLILAGATLAAVDELALDDECSVDSSTGCALNALQHRTGRVGSSDPGSDYNTCQDCMQKNFEPSAQILGAAPIRNYARDCWRPCHGSGHCSWCGAGNACCRYRARNDPPECGRVLFWPVLSFHTCVQPHVQAQAAVPMPMVPSLPGSGNYIPLVRELSMPSQAPLFSFYMYRAMGEDDYPSENVNTANLPGVIWYLHNEVVVETPRKFGITRIVRLKVQTKAPQPLANRGMNFGVRYAFDSGKCTGPWSCSDQFSKYGFFVGCNAVGEFPTEKWKRENHYNDATWYSLPGPCSSRKYDQHDDLCAGGEPGGACAGVPTGTGNCTYSYTPAGEIRLDELEGIEDYNAFIAAGHREYIRRQDHGVGLSFWDGKYDAARCQQRVDAAERLFALKYGPPEVSGNPKCDFNFHGFYR